MIKISIVGWTKIAFSINFPISLIHGIEYYIYIIYGGIGSK
jgi:hypothetical protein